MSEERISMGDILDEGSDEKPIDPPAEKPEGVEKHEGTEPEVERNTSRRKAHLEKEKAAQAEGRPRDESGKFAAAEKPAEGEAKPEEKPAEKPAEAKPAAEELTAREKAYYAKAQEELRKRQQLETRIAALEAGKPTEEKKDFWADPEGAVKASENNARALAMQTRFQVSEMMVRPQYPDYDEKIEVFKGLVASTPGLMEQLLSAPNPAEFAMKTASGHLQVQQAGNIEALKAEWLAKGKETAKAEFEAEAKAKQAENEKLRAGLTPSLGDARGTRGQNRPVWNGPTPMADILNG